MVVCLKIPFHPNQPIFGHNEVYFFFSFFSFFFLFFFLFFLFFLLSFFFLFFFLIFVRSSSPKPQHIEIKFLCKVVELQTKIFLPKFFLLQLHREPPENGAPKNPFFEWLKLECYFFFDISRYLTDKYFDILWGCHPP